jgi:hypothetical protein
MGVMAGAPLWKQGLDALERVVAPPVECAVGTDAFATAIGLVAWVRHGVAQEAERRTRRLWHFLNLPAATDVRLLRHQVDQLERELRRLTAGT